MQISFLQIVDDAVALSLTAVCSLYVTASAQISGSHSAIFCPLQLKKWKKDASFSSHQEPQQHKLYTLDSTFPELNLIQHNTLNKWVILFFCFVESATEWFKIALRYVHLMRSSSTCLVSLRSPLESHAAQTEARVQEYSRFIPTTSEQYHHCT